MAEEKTTDKKSWKDVVAGWTKERLEEGLFWFGVHRIGEFLRNILTDETKKRVEGAYRYLEDMSLWQDLFWAHVSTEVAPVLPAETANLRVWLARRENKEELLYKKGSFYKANDGAVAEFTLAKWFKNMSVRMENGPEGRPGPVRRELREEEREARRKAIEYFVTLNDHQKWDDMILIIAFNQPVQFLGRVKEILMEHMPKLDAATAAVVDTLLNDNVRWARNGLRKLDDPAYRPSWLKSNRPEMIERMKAYRKDNPGRLRLIANRLEGQAKRFNNWARTKAWPAMKRGSEKFVAWRKLQVAKFWDWRAKRRAERELKERERRESRERTIRALERNPVTVNMKVKRLRIEVLPTETGDKKWEL